MNQSQVLAHHAQIMHDFYHHVNEVRKEPLHKGQVQVLKALFVENKQEIQCQWGRSGGKTATIMAAAWLWALLKNDQLIYIIAPQRSHGKKIFWTSLRIQKFGPPQYLEETRDSELILVFKNGSKIIIDGSENYDALRGIKPNLVFYDEFQNHSREFDVEVMEPNRTAKNSSLVVMGTPPKTDCYYVEYRKNLLEAIARGNNKKVYYELPSSVNPSLDPEMLREIEVKLRGRGDEKIWLREYEGKLIFGGEGAIFPDFDEAKHVYSHEFILKLIERDKHKLSWSVWFDPGTTTCFAGLFIAWNPYTSQIFVLDEIYEKERRKTTSVQIWDVATKKKEALFPVANKWMNYYDEAAAWFANEIQDSFGESLFPTRKQKVTVRHDEGRAGESLIKDIMISENKLFISEKCINFIWEIQNYVTDSNGNYPTSNDHLMDCFHYFITNGGYELNEGVNKEELEEIKYNRKYRYTTLQHELDKIKKKNDWLHGVDVDYYDNDEVDLWIN